jgi:hypothetical protein
MKKCVEIELSKKWSAKDRRGLAANYEKKDKFCYRAGRLALSVVEVWELGIGSCHYPFPFPLKPKA